MFKFFSLTAYTIGIASSLVAEATTDPMTPKEIDLNISDDFKTNRQAPPTIKTSFSPFTGKVNGEKVRIRLQPDLESQVIQELSNNEYVSVVAQEGEFYCIEPNSSLKAYVFRSFVLDGVIEGSRVNVRLEPDLEAPVIGHVNSGDKVDGKVVALNRKWLEITPPSNTRFYVSKEYIEYAGTPDLKENISKRKETVEQLLKEAELFANKELDNEFEEINFEKIKEGYLTIIQNYNDFPKRTQQAKESLAKVQEDYLQKRISYLEKKADLVASGEVKPETSSDSFLQEWQNIEQGLYTTWAHVNEKKPIETYYEEQRVIATSITGVLEPFKSSVRNKPGDYVLKHKNLPIAYVYSTIVELDDFLGKQVTLLGSSRSNNNFAFPAYFIHEVE